MINKSALIKTSIIWLGITAVVIGACFIPDIMAAVLLYGLAAVVLGGLVYATYCIFDDSGYDYYGWYDEY